MNDKIPVNENCDIPPNQQIGICINTGSRWVELVIPTEASETPITRYLTPARARFIAKILVDMAKEAEANEKAKAEAAMVFEFGGGEWRPAAKKPKRSRK